MEDLIKKLNENNVSIIGDIFIKNRHKIIKLKCKCGEIFEVRFNRVLKENRMFCRKCISDKRLKTDDLFLSQVKEVSGDEYTFLESYKKAKEKIKVRHNICGHEYYVTPDKFLKGNRCPKCSNHIVKNYTLALEKLKELNLDKKYEMIEMTGEGYKAEIKVKCLECNEIFSTTYNALFNRGIKCKICGFMSKGENKITEFLNKNNIKYKHQYYFKDLKFITYLRFDFAIFDKENNLKCLIEYDGEGHYKPINFNKLNNEDLCIQFENSKNRDNMKDIYCKNKNINLLRIPYWDMSNIENILTSYFNNIKI